MDLHNIVRGRHPFQLLHFSDRLRFLLFCRKQADLLLLRYGLSYHVLIFVFAAGFQAALQEDFSVPAKYVHSAACDKAATVCKVQKKSQPI